MSSYKKRKEQAKIVRDELDTFNDFFACLLSKHVFDAFSQKLEECRQFGEDSQQQGLILLKLCGSLIDVRFMLETVCKKLDLSCIFVEEHTNPLDLLKKVVDSEESHLVHIQDNVSLNYLNRLLETFRSSDKSVSLVVTIRSNDSHFIRLDPSLAASIPVESFVFSDPEPLFERLVNEMVLEYTRKTGLILSGPLLKRLKDSFIKENQSFVELQNIVGMSIAKFGMGKHLGSKKERVRAVMSDFEKYWLLLELFTKFLERESTLDDRSLSTLDVHIAIQSDNEWYEGAFKRATSYWSNADKNTWLQFLSFCEDLAEDFQRECISGKTTGVSFELEEIKKKAEETNFESVAAQMSRNMTTSPSRRKITSTTQQTKGLVSMMNELFSSLKPFSDYSIPQAVPFQSCQDENMDDSQLPDFVKTSPCF